MSDRVARPRDCRGLEPHNRLLATLPGRDLQSVQPHLKAAPLANCLRLYQGLSSSGAYSLEHWIAAAAYGEG